MKAEVEVFGEWPLADGTLKPLLTRDTLKFEVEVQCWGMGIRRWVIKARERVSSL